MNIEIGESLGYSYLRHVKGCWLVQTNWKPSEHWDPKGRTDDELEQEFQEMRTHFDPEGVVFKGTKDSGQFLKQAEIDVIGVDQNGGIHAMDVAFHEAGLNYLGGADNRVLKKLLRTKLVIDAYHPADTKRDIYFVSPKVHRGVQQPLDEIFTRLQEAYQSIGWHLLTNEKFSDEILDTTLDKTQTVADTSELFVRSAKLIKLSLNEGVATRQPRPSNQGVAESEALSVENRNYASGTEPPKGFQRIVRSLMSSLLEDHPELLSDEDRRNLMDSDYCRRRMGLSISGFALLRRQEDGRLTNGHARYFRRVYAGRYYVCSQWWKDHHYHNAASLLRFVETLLDNRPSSPAIPSLQTHQMALKEFLGSAGSV